MLPAGDGDCLLVQAKTAAGAATTIMVDGGRGRSYLSWKPHLKRLLGDRKVVDLLVVTHIDADHIEGVLSFLKDPGRDVVVSEIWFNGHAQILAVQRRQADIETFSPKQADDLSRTLKDLGIVWNQLVAGGPICRDTVKEFISKGLFEISVVTPSSAKLAAVAGKWDSVIAETSTGDTVISSGGLEVFGAPTIDVEELAASPDVPDRAAPNGSSIGLIIRAVGHTLLLTGDCHADDLAGGLRGLGANDELPLELSIMKVSHHGAEKNTSKEALALVRSQVYAFSTDGQHRDHPDACVVAKILKSSSTRKVLAFNYRSKRSAVWEGEDLQARHNYSTLMPERDSPGSISIKLQQPT